MREISREADMSKKSAEKMASSDKIVENPECFGSPICLHRRIVHTIFNIYVSLYGEERMNINLHSLEHFCPHVPSEGVMTKKYLVEKELVAVPFDKGVGYCVMKHST